jgi:hypothetical protein
MPEVRFTIDEAYLNQIRENLADPDRRTTDIMRDALTILTWASGERRKGRYVVSTTNEGKDVERLAVPSLEAGASICAGRNVKAA